MESKQVATAMLDCLGFHWLDSGSESDKPEVAVETAAEVTVISFDDSDVNTDVNNNKMEGHSCDICEKQFSSQSNLNKHIKRIHGDDEFQCHICNNVFKTENDLKCHIASHSSDPFQCEVCSKLYKSKDFSAPSVGTILNIDLLYISIEKKFASST